MGNRPVGDGLVPSRAAATTHPDAGDAKRHGGDNNVMRATPHITGREGVASMGPGMRTRIDRQPFER